MASASQMGAALSSRCPSDYSDFSDAFFRNREWKRPVRSLVPDGPCVTNTPDAVWWLYTPHDESGRPVRGFDPNFVYKPVLYWKSWEKPSPCLPIDHIIETLITARYPKESNTKNSSVRRGAGFPTSYDVRKIIPKEELRGLSIKNGEFAPIHCPYSYVREELSGAVGLAYDDKNAGEEYRRNASTRVRALKEALLALNRAVDDIAFAKSAVKKAQLSISPLKYTLHDPKFRFDGIETKIKENLLSANKSILDAIDDIKSKEGSISEAGKPEDIWWTSFIKSCATIWTNITGVPPNNGHAAFMRFLEAANESLGGKSVEFRDKVKSVIKRVNGDGDRPGMASYDRFDAEAKGFLPPEAIPELSQAALIKLLLSDKRTIKELMVDALDPDLPGNFITRGVLEMRILMLDDGMRKEITKIMGEIGL